MKNQTSSLAEYQRGLLIGLDKGLRGMRPPPGYLRLARKKPGSPFGTGWRIGFVEGRRAHGFNPASHSRRHLEVLLERRDVEALTARFTPAKELLGGGDAA